MIKLLVASATTVALLGASQVSTADSSSVLASIANEIKLLRGSIEKANDNQIQIQAISVYLTNEQGRLAQLGSRLDSIRHDLDIAAADSREAAAAVTSMENILAGNTIQGQEKEQYQRQLDIQKRSADVKAQKESQLRSREQDALQEFQTDRDQYTALLARLQQFIK